MGKYINTAFFAVFLACVASCSTKRAITHERENIALDARFTELINTSANVVTKDNTRKIDSLLSLSVIEFEIYDTSVDKLLMKGTIRQESNEKIIEEHDVTRDTEINQNILIEDTIAYEEYSEFSKTTDKTKGDYDLLILFIVFALVFTSVKTLKKK